MARRVNGYDIIYHYLQKVIAAQNDDFSRNLISRLILDLSIWLPVRLYQEMPILFPQCVRDPKIKDNGWGTANEDGFFRDNNNLLKNLVVGYDIQSGKTGIYRTAARGRGFTACHVWRRIKIDGKACLSATHPKTYSFVPNLAWLPAQIAKLTDREGSYAQQVLKTISHALYSPYKEMHPQPLAAIWDSLEAPGLDLRIDPGELNTFKISERSIKLRRNYILRDLHAIENTVLDGVKLENGGRSRRYLPSLHEIPGLQSSDFFHWLSLYKVYLISRSMGEI
jgi:hypothetical protein